MLSGNCHDFAKANGYQDQYLSHFRDCAMKPYLAHLVT